jgi:hypothetical protein
MQFFPCFQPSQKIQQQEEEQAAVVLKMEITALKQQQVANQHEIRVKDERIDQLIREIRNLVNYSLFYLCLASAAQNLVV